MNSPQETEVSNSDVLLTEDMFTVLGSVFEETSGWGWLMLFCGILAGLVVGRILQLILRRLCTHFRNRGNQVTAVAFESTVGPVALTVLAMGIQFGLLAVRMPPEMANFSGDILKFFYLLSMGWFLFNLVDLIDVILNRHLEKTNNKFAAQITPMLRKAFRIFVVIIFVMFIAQNVFGVNITAWLAGLGIAGLAISLASQDSVRNIFGSVTVMLDKPFMVGDRIQFSGVEGTVEEIGLRSTRIRTFAGHLVTVPNMRFIDGTVENVTARPFMRRALNVTITYDTPAQKIDQAVEIIKAILSDPEMSAPFNLEGRPPRVYFNDFNADSLNISVSYWYIFNNEKGHDWWGYLAHAELFNKRLFSAFAETGIEFAFPTQTLYLAGDPQRALNVGLHDARIREER